MATSFFYIYIDMYKLMERPVVLLNAIFWKAVLCDQLATLFHHPGPC